MKTGKINKNIVVFGCDNSGKTNLCHNLKDKLYENAKVEVEIVKSIGPNKRIEEYVEFMENNLNKDCITIFDRFPIIEEATTGIILRHENIFDKVVDQQHMFDKFFDKVDLFIYCYPGMDNILNWGRREQMEGIKDNVNYLIPAYLQYALMLKNYGYNVMEYNYNYYSEHQTWKFIKELEK